MKWFKHLAGSLDDMFVSSLIERFGGDGYLVFFGVLEILADEFNENSPGNLEISYRFLHKKLQLSQQKTRKILKYCHEKGRFFVSENGSHVSIQCPKFIKYCDEYTAKLLSKKLRSQSGDSPESLPENVQTEEEIRNKKQNKEEETYNKTILSSFQKKDSVKVIKKDHCPYEKIIELYHSLLPAHPKIKVWNKTDKSSLKRRWEEDPARQSLDWWEKYFHYVGQSDFLCGKKTDFIATLSWLIGPKNIGKVLNGQYHHQLNGEMQKHEGLMEWLREKEHEKI